MGVWLLKLGTAWVSGSALQPAPGRPERMGATQARCFAWMMCVE